MEGLKKKYLGVAVIALFLFSIIIPYAAFAQAPVAVITLADGTVVSMTPAKLSALAAQPGITLSAAVPVVGATQVAIPLPAALGGGYLVGTPAAIASGLSAAGIATGITASAIVGATAAAGTITAGAMAGTVAALGVAGTVAAAAVVAGAIVAGVAAAIGEDVTTTHHH